MEAEAEVEAVDGGLKEAEVEAKEKFTTVPSLLLSSQELWILIFGFTKCPKVLRTLDTQLQVHNVSKVPVNNGHYSLGS